MTGALVRVAVAGRCVGAKLGVALGVGVLVADGRIVGVGVNAMLTAVAGVVEVLRGVALGWLAKLIPVQ